jgi:hypothetical protein
MYSQKSLAADIMHVTRVSRYSCIMRARRRIGCVRGCFVCPV